MFEGVPFWMTPPKWRRFADRFITWTSFDGEFVECLFYPAIWNFEWSCGVSDKTVASHSWTKGLSLEWFSTENRKEINKEILWKRWLVANNEQNHVISLRGTSLEPLRFDDEFNARKNRFSPLLLFASQLSRKKQNPREIDNVSKSD